MKHLKRLAGSHWGADKNTLRQLYLSFVRSVIDYNLTFQSIGSYTAQEARFVLGAMRTATATSETHTKVEQLHLRREAAVKETDERYKKQTNKQKKTKQLLKPLKRKQR